MSTTTSTPLDSEVPTDIPLKDSSSISGKIPKPRAIHRAEKQIGHTRISGAWAAVAVAAVLGVALIDFIVENTRSVRIDFFSAHGQMPVAVALLAAALAGATVVLAVGVCRTAQLRLTIRRRRRQSADSAPPIAQLALGEPSVPQS